MAKTFTVTLKHIIEVVVPDEHKYLTNLGQAELIAQSFLDFDEEENQDRAENLPVNCYVGRAHGSVTSYVVELTATEKT